MNHPRPLVRRPTLRISELKDAMEILPEHEVEQYISCVNTARPCMEFGWMKDSPNKSKTEPENTLINRQSNLGWDTIFRGILRPLSYENRMLRKNVTVPNKEPVKVLSAHINDLRLENSDADESVELERKRQTDLASYAKLQKLRQDPKRLRLAEISANLWKNEENAKAESLYPKFVKRRTRPITGKGGIPRNGFVTGRVLGVLRVIPNIDREGDEPKKFRRVNSMRKRF